MPGLFRLSRCPYCHKRISYPTAAFLKNKGEYCCRSCRCISDVVISRAAYGIASGVCIIALLIVVLYTMSGDHGKFTGMILVLAPFLLFYLIVPFLVRLAPCKDRSAVQKLIENNTAPRPTQPHVKSKPVKLSVEDDFSAKFMMAKNNSHTGHFEKLNSIPDLPPEEIQSGADNYDTDTSENTSAPDDDEPEQVFTEYDIDD